MFKQQAISKLPTFLQFMKEHELRETDFDSRIDKILWGDQWKSITFQTTEFRYSVKFNTEEEYNEATRQVLDVFKPNAPMHAWVVYDSQTGEVEIEWVPIEPSPDSEQFQFRQWDWGLTSEPFVPKAPAPAKQKKPSAKLKKAAEQPQEQALF